MSRKARPETARISARIGFDFPRAEGPRREAEKFLAEVEEERRKEQREKQKGRPLKKSKLDDWVADKETLESIRIQAGMLGALVCIGFFLFLLLLRVPIWGALLVGGILGATAGWQLYQGKKPMVDEDE